MWVVRLTDKQLEVLRALLRSEEHLGPALKGSIEALELAVEVVELGVGDLGLVQHVVGVLVAPDGLT